MSVPLYMDVHVHRAITEGLRIRGVDVLTAQDDTADQLPDEDLLQRATELGRVLFTYDDDLLDIATDWTISGRAYAGSLYIHVRHIVIGWCVTELEVLLQAGLPSDFQNRVQFLSHPGGLWPT